MKNLLKEKYTESNLEEILFSSSINLKSIESQNIKNIIKSNKYTFWIYQDSSIILVCAFALVLTYSPLIFFNDLISSFILFPFMFIGVAYLYNIHLYSKKENLVKSIISELKKESIIIKEDDPFPYD